MTDVTTDRAALLERAAFAGSGLSARYLTDAEADALSHLSELVKAYREATRQPRLDAANQILAWCRGDDA